MLLKVGLDAFRVLWALLPQEEIAITPVGEILSENIEPRVQDRTWETNIIRLGGQI